MPPALKETGQDIHQVRDQTVRDRTSTSKTRPGLAFLTATTCCSRGVSLEAAALPEAASLSGGASRAFFFNKKRRCAFSCLSLRVSFAASTSAANSSADFTCRPTGQVIMDSTYVKCRSTSLQQAPVKQTFSTTDSCQCCRFSRNIA